MNNETNNDQQQQKELIQRLESEIATLEAKLHSAENYSVLGMHLSRTTHLINNHLGAIVLAATNALWLQNKPDQAATVSKCLSDILQHAKTAGQVVKSVTTLIQPKASPESKADLAIAVTKALAELQAKPASAKTTIKTDIPSDLGKVTIDQPHLDYLILELLSNAVSAEAKSISISARDFGHMLSVTISDDGLGIAPDELTRVFEPYSTAKAKGSVSLGLGLAVCKAIAEQNQGDITLKSELGKGSTVSLSLLTA